jgi:hypothetical protein
VVAPGALVGLAVEFTSVNMTEERALLVDNVGAIPVAATSRSR